MEENRSRANTIGDACIFGFDNVLLFVVVTNKTWRFFSRETGELPKEKATFQRKALNIRFCSLDHTRLRDAKNINSIVIVSTAQSRGNK